MRTIDGIVYKQTEASHWSVNRIKVRELEGILLIEAEGIGNWPLQNC